MFSYPIYSIERRPHGNSVKIFDVRKLVGLTGGKTSLMIHSIISTQTTSMTDGRTQNYISIYSFCTVFWGNENARSNSFFL